MPGGVREAIRAELALIAAKDIAQYFLTIHDIVHFARHRAEPADPVPGAGLGGELGRVLLP